MNGTCFSKLIQPTLLLLISTASLSLAVNDIASDKTALLYLKSHITYDPNHVLANWTTTSPVCSWIGVTCGSRHNRVTVLDISEMDLTGAIPSEIGNLSFIASLSIRNNNFYGFLPKELTRLSRLKHLDFGFNFFEGSIPQGLESLPKLKTLLLEFNKLEGKFPFSLCNMSSLQSINISSNQLTDLVLSNILLESSLEIVDLSSNEISGGLPMDICNHLPKLRGLYLNNNSFSDAIPEQIGDLTNLEKFKIHYNVLSGNIPSTFFNISTMKAIWMQENFLSGPLPSTINLPKLVELYLAGNVLTGMIPGSITNATRLTILDLSYNHFSGSIPVKLGNLRELQVLSLAYNDLRSESSSPESNFFTSLKDCSNLVRIDLSGCLLYTTLPVSIRNLSTSLQYLLAESCEIKGTVPGDVDQLSNLISLNLGYNDLTGNIPATTGRLKRLQGLSLQGNKLEGSIPTDLCLLNNLFVLSLGHNMLIGFIPDCLGDLETLRHLNLSSNSLISTIPSTFSNLRDILTVDISSNLLTGSLPQWFGQLEVTEQIDLSNNLLSGEIPFTLFTSLKSLAYLSLAKNQLHGPIPDPYKPSVSLVYLDLSCNNLSGTIPKSLDANLYLHYFNVSVNGLEGEIPNEGPFANFTARSYMMNKALCGPLQLGVPRCKLDVLHRSANNHIFLLKFILPWIAFVTFIIIWWRWNKEMIPSAIISSEPHEIKRFSFLELEQATDGFSGGNLLGVGSAGSVYKGTLQDSMVVAIKVFNLEKNLRSFGAECEVLRHRSHRNLIRVICYCSMVNFKAIVMEYMTNGNLEKWLYTHNYRLDILQRLDIMIDVAAAVKYLHYDFPRPIIHCDLKPSNVLLDEDMVARVSDFSIAKLLAAKEWDSATQGHFMGTVGYVAPECGLYGIISTKADVYSFGIMLMEIFTAKKPIDDMFTGEKPIRRWIVESLQDEVGRVMDPCLLQSEEENFAAKMVCMLSLMKLAVWCTVESPDGRTNMEDVVNILNMIKQVFLKNTLGDH